MSRQSDLRTLFIGAVVVIAIPLALEIRRQKDADPWAGFPIVQAAERWGENDPIIEPGRNPALRHLPIYQFRYADGWTYGVQAETPEAATAIFESIKATGNGQYLHRVRDRIIQHPFDLFEGSPNNLPPLPPGWVPVPPEGMWPAANTTQPRRQ